MIPKTFKKPNSPFRARTQPMKRSLTEDVSTVNVTSSAVKPVFLTKAEWSQHNNNDLNKKQP